MWPAMKTVVSVSLGSSRRDFSFTASFLGEEFSISRVGTDGSLETFAAKLRELDGRVDAIGLGGIDRWLVAGGRRYEFRDARRLAANARVTPVVDGSGLKNTLERQAVLRLEENGVVDFRSSKTLVVCAVDRFGMAEEVAALGGPAIYGDLMFSLGLPFPIRNFATVRVLARVLLPVIVRLPFKWLYPTGEKQERMTPRFGWVFRWADVVAGDFHLIRRFLPEGEKALAGKTILTNTTTPDDRELLRSRGLKRLVTTTQSFGGRSTGTNVLEAVLVAATGRRPEDLAPEDYERLLEQLGWSPEITEFETDGNGD